MERVDGCESGSEMFDNCREINVKFHESCFVFAGRRAVGGAEFD
jgi:hypothetical protein